MFKICEKEIDTGEFVWEKESQRTPIDEYIHKYMPQNIQATEEPTKIKTSTHIAEKRTNIQRKRIVNITV